MKKIFRYIFILTLTIGVFSWADKLPQRYLEKVNTIYSLNSDTYSYQDTSIDACNLPIIPEAELGSIGFTFHNPVTSRLLRFHSQNYFYSMKYMSRQLCERENNLTANWEKSYDDFILSVSHPISEYYVFGLRHIII